MTAGWCARTVRAAVFAAVCVLLAGVGHVMMSNSDLPAWTLAAGVAATGVAGWCLAGRERGLPVVVAVAVAAQTALHSAFSLAQPAAGDATAAGAHTMGPGHMSSTPLSGMRMGHMEGHPAADSLSHAGHSMTGGGAGDTSSIGMLAAHLLAALLTGLWLAHGERAVFRILRAVAGWLAAPLRLPLAPSAAPGHPRPRPRRPRSDRAPGGGLPVHTITSRGPPPGTAAV
ncbi:hypothetical protein HTV45_02555 [Streptomyces sp. CHD11]|uniref:hypothetical protein n=1 Tax=Streptomyces sp. CHD11 TaxID=2741325 RepID=UPI001BFCA644|nr:hypothetical protein [Streptomyces sp. CHD11]MBT3149803.1 hypothetical protein [Streptomyces sp. CHD11]